MKPIPGAPKPTPQQLLRVRERLSFVYVERCLVNRASNAITVSNSKGTVHLPSATLSVLLLGPGCRVTHHAVMLLGESGTSAVWVGEGAVRYYAHGSSLARSTSLLIRQAEMVSNKRERLAAARMMYSMRFPGEDVSALTMQQLRGREGARVRRAYREESQRTGVPWERRTYDPNDFSGGDAVNQALSAANYALYGVIHSVVVSLGLAPGLGVVHTGQHRSFIYDIADLYKAETSIPVAFDVAKESPDDVGPATRREMRNRLYEHKILERSVNDIQTILGVPVDESLEVSYVEIWDSEGINLAAGMNYAEAEWSSSF
ncbi:MAG TPA: type I-E CRISPR-associated endonuclease Cas1e [Actinomycetaceae bacterium]|nr:type I-E CRISPR-associated endonuclease Cas1e [Actinomycetaceae bacterium]